MSETNNLTIIILTHRNDERFLRALDSAQFAQTVMILDHNSKNNWSQINNSYHFDVHKISTMDSFAKVKNSVKKSIKTNWTLFLDSDEFISKPLQNEILYSIDQDSVSAYRIHRIDAFLGKTLHYGETRSSNPIRLIQTSLIEWQGSAHEELIAPKNTATLNLPLLHIPHTSISEFLAKINSYTSILAKQQESFLLLKMAVLPVGKFVWTFIWQMGWRDGMRGFIYSFIMSLHSLTVRVKRYETNNI